MLPCRRECYPVLILRLLEVEEDAVDRRGLAMHSPVRDSTTHCMILGVREEAVFSRLTCLRGHYPALDPPGLLGRRGGCLVSLLRDPSPACDIADMGLIILLFSVAYLYLENIRDFLLAGPKNTLCKRKAFYGNK